MQDAIEARYAAFRELLENSGNWTGDTVYREAVKSLGSLEPTKEGIEEFANSLRHNWLQYWQGNQRFSSTGYFFSALVNRAEEKKDQEIILNFGEVKWNAYKFPLGSKMSGLGYMFPRGRLVVVGGADDFGRCQIGGNLHLVGNAIYGVNLGQIGGETVIEGHSGTATGIGKIAGVTKAMECGPQVAESGSGGLVEAEVVRGGLTGLRNKGTVIKCKGSIFGNNTADLMESGEIYAAFIEHLAPKERIGRDAKIFTGSEGNYRQISPE